MCSESVAKRRKRAVRPFPFLEANDEGSSSDSLGFRFVHSLCLGPRDRNLSDVVKKPPLPNSLASLFRPPEENSRLFLLLFLAVLAAFGPFVTDLYLPTLPEQAREYAAAPATVQLGLSMTMWGLAIGQLFVGPLSDVRGRRGPLLASLFVFTGATFGAAVAPSIELFLVWRFLEGLGASGAIVMSRAVAADRYTGRALGQFMAVMGAIQGVAPITAPLLGSLVAELVGCRGIFWLLFAMGVALLFVTAWRLAETRRSGPRNGKTSSVQPEGVRGSLRALFGDRAFVAIVLQQIFASAVLFGHIASSPFIFQEHFGLSSFAYGILFGVMALGITVGASFSSRMSSPETAMLAGAVGLLAASVLLALEYALGATLLWVAPVYFLLLVMLGLTLPAAMTAALSRHRARSGLAAAVLGAVGFGGGGLVAPLTTLGTPTVTTAWLFIVSAVVLVVIGVVLRRLTREKRA